MPMNKDIDLWNVCCCCVYWLGHLFQQSLVSAKMLIICVLKILTPKFVCFSKVVSLKWRSLCVVPIFHIHIDFIFIWNVTNEILQYTQVWIVQHLFWQLNKLVFWHQLNIQILPEYYIWHILFTVFFHGNPLHNYMHDKLYRRGHFFNRWNNNITSATNAYFRSVKHDMLFSISYSNFATIYILFTQHFFWM